MHQEQRQRTQDLLKAKGIDQALFANFNSLKWLTGFSPTLQTGSNFFAGRPPLVWYEGGHSAIGLCHQHEKRRSYPVPRSTGRVVGGRGAVTAPEWGQFVACNNDYFMEMTILEWQTDKELMSDRG